MPQLFWPGVLIRYPLPLRRNLPVQGRVALNAYADPPVYNVYAWPGPF